MNTTEDTRLILGSIRALWGLVTPALRSVSVELKDNTIHWQSIFDENATGDEIELIKEASSQLIADFPYAVLNETIIMIPYPREINNLENLIYLRHE